MTRCFAALLLTVLAQAQTDSIRVGGVYVRLGMPKDSVIASFADNENAKLIDLHDGSYLVTSKSATGLWDGLGGQLTFESGKLSRISVDNSNAANREAANFAKAVYTALAAAEPTGLVDFWLGRNDDANNPIYEVHLVLKDREVVISADSVGGRDLAFVKTFYPRARRAK